MKKLIITLMLLSGIAHAGHLTQSTVELQNIIDDADTKAGVFAVLTAPSNTTCTTASTWYQVQGVFTNKVIEGFAVSGTNIVCQIAETNQYEIDWHCSVQGDSSDVPMIPHVTVKINDTVYEDEMMGTLLKNGAQPYAFSGTIVVPLSSNDTVQLVCESNSDGDVITFNHFVTSLTKFFLTRE